MIVNHQISELLKQLQSEAGKVINCKSKITDTTDFNYKKHSMRLSARGLFSLNLDIRHQIVRMKQVEDKNVIVVGDMEMEINLRINDKLKSVSSINEAFEEANSILKMFGFHGIVKTSVERVQDLIYLFIKVNEYLSESAVAD